MPSQDLFFFAKGKVCFPSGKIDPDACTVEDFQPIVGYVPAAGSVKNPNQLVYPYSFGSLRLFLHPEEAVGEKSPVLMFWIELAQPIPLGALIRQYKIQPKLIVQEVDDGSGGSEMIYTAMFSPNFGVEFDLQTKLVSTYVFAKMNYVLNCRCSSCALVRQQFELPHPD